MYTINDVAKAAGVSISTVSKVFNGRGGVGEATRKNVLKIAQEMDYFPSKAAAQLASRTEDTIGVILSSLGTRDSKDEYILRMLNGIFGRAAEEEYHVALYTTKSILNQNQNYVQFCYANNLIGAIIHGLDVDDPHLQRLVDSDIPCVFIDLYAGGKKTASVSTDNIKASQEVIQKLVGLGHRQILFVSGGMRSMVSLQRLEGYAKSMKRYGELKLRVLNGDYDKDKTYTNVKEYLLLNPEITAIFCSSDLMAIGAIDACMDLGYHVPQDISVVGFDDLAVATLIRPNLSTVRQEFYDMGAKAAELLLSIYNGKEAQTVNLISYQVEFRESVSCARKETLN